MSLVRQPRRHAGIMSDPQLPLVSDPGAQAVMNEA